MKSPILLIALVAGLAACKDSSSPSTTCVIGPQITTSAVNGAITSQDCAAAFTFDRYAIHLNANQPYLFTLTWTGSWKPFLADAFLTDTVLLQHASINVTDGNTKQLGLVSSTARDEQLDVVALSGTGPYTLRQENCAFDATPVDPWANDSVVGAISASDCVLRDSLLPADSMHVHLYSFDYPDTASKHWRIVVRALSGTGLGAPLATQSVWFWGPMNSPPGTAATQGFAYTVAGDSTFVIGPQPGLGKGKYIMAVGGGSFSDAGAYSVILTPANF